MKYENKISYKLADEKDIEQIIKLRLELLEFYNKDFSNLKNELVINTKQFLEKHLNKDMFYYIAKIDDEVVATSSLTIQEIMPKPNNIYGIVGKLGQVYTTDQYRRLGIQKTLISLVIELAKEKDCKKIYLEAINAHAINLYNQFGFKLVEDKYELKFN